MPLPTSRPTQQRSIRSFFQSPKTPQFLPPPLPQAVKPTDAAILPRASQSPAAASPTSSSSSSQAQISDTPLLPPPRPPVTSKTNPLLPREAIIRSVEPHDITALRRLHSLLLPVAFSDSFYRAVLDPAQSHRYSRVIVWSEDDDDDDDNTNTNTNTNPNTNPNPNRLSRAQPKIVGVVVCIPEPSNSNSSNSSSSPLLPPSTSAPLTTLYIRSLGILAPYRSLGLVNAALDDILAATTTTTTDSSTSLNLGSVTAHVWTENDTALQWYLRRGFERQGDAIPGYYRKLRPDSAYLLSRLLCPAATAATATAPVASSSRPLPPAKAQSFQNQRPDVEWNDLPADMMAPSSLALPRRTLAAVTATANAAGSSEPGSVASSRSNSSATQRKKRDRSYPAAAFGN